MIGLGWKRGTRMLVALSGMTGCLGAPGAAAQLGALPFATLPASGDAPAH
jgi:hypothetical protein